MRHIVTDRFSSIFVADFTPESRTQHHSTKHDLTDSKQYVASVTRISTILPGDKLDVH